MTYIEFFDTSAVENICECLVEKPDRVILVGDNKKKLEKHARRYHEIFADKGIKIDFLWRVITRNNLDTITEQLTMIVETWKDCVFDLTGGEDLYLVAVGMICERYPEKNIRLRRINFRSNLLYESFRDGVTIRADEYPVLSVEDNIRFFGGNIVYTEQKSAGTYRWQWDDSFRAQVRAMWDICRVNVREWNIRTSVFAIADRMREAGSDPLTTVVSVGAIKDYLHSFGREYIPTDRVLTELQEAGLVTSREEDGRLILSYPGRQIRRCLTKEGLALELRITLCALEARDKDGVIVYNDAKNGVFIDWDGDVHTDPDTYDTENEIDVIMMRGMIPVFVSCKNGSVDTAELYKLSSVTRRFGGKYGKSVLIATSLPPNSPSTEHFRRRAEDMGIRLVTGVQHMSESALERTVASFWSN